MRRLSATRVHLATLLLLPLLSGCSRGIGLFSSHAAQKPAATVTPIDHIGFDRNDYPGDAAMAALHRTFAFTGYWITPPPEETTNTWAGKRKHLLRQGWGFLVLANGRLDKEILAAQKTHTTPEALARKDAAGAIVSAKKEDFPPHTILFLDQEEGGRLLPEQAAYLLAWTEAVAASDYLPGVYASGQPAPDGPGQTITTIDDIRQQVTAKHLHPIAIFDAQDACPPAPGCSLHPKPLNTSGELDLSPSGNLVVWQYAQSPRRPEITQSCAATYATDGNCYPPGFPKLFLDLDSSSTDDPSHGR
ncbi:DUF1906 domain-containing protein [Granulicella sp. 5B5]|uniref:glycoside hydrolase domain-containing protein n=1 Tax=Granulicella sp. 5B5 TaxID=1617967 RepID=UPI0015F69291|nr:glycoside hydrolase domain-containing protein [Granulicella sp. 5B5]QMV19056.1 DUF1906 domain-containing protein [Granulicella sp. 5B5]